MTQNTHNVRTRREQLSTYPESVCVGRYSGDTWQLELDGDDLDADRLVEGPVLYVRCDIAHRSQTEAEARCAAEEQAKSIGYLFANPDTGTEYLPYHPIESGECQDAENIREATSAELLSELQAAWTSWKEDRDEKERVSANVAALEARVKELEKELSFYADPSNYIDSGFFEGDPDLVTPKCIPVLRHGEDGSPCDCGDTARAALTREGGCDGD